MRFAQRAFIIGTLLLLGTALPRASSADVIDLITGESVRGTIKGATATGIVIDVGGRERTIEQRLVRGIVFDSGPAPAPARTPASKPPKAAPPRDAARAAAAPATPAPPPPSAPESKPPPPKQTARARAAPATPAPPPPAPESKPPPPKQTARARAAPATPVPPPPAPESKPAPPKQTARARAAPATPAPPPPAPESKPAPETEAKPAEPAPTAAIQTPRPAPPPRPALDLASVSPATLREAIQALSDLRAAAVDDISRADYAARADEAKPRVERYLSDRDGRAEVKEAIASAMRLYSFAATAWSVYSMRGDFATVGRDPALAECPRLQKAIAEDAARWQFDAKNPGFAGMLAGSEGLPDLWACAADRLAEAEQLIAAQTP
jgi:hypothetical protein